MVWLCYIDFLVEVSVGVHLGVLLNGLHWLLLFVLHSEWLMGIASCYMMKW